MPCGGRSKIVRTEIPSGDLDRLIGNQPGINHPRERQSNPVQCAKSYSFKPCGGRGRHRAAEADDQETDAVLLINRAGRQS